MNTAAMTGFPDAARQSQSVFRTVMRAMSRPGHVVEVGTSGECPVPLMPASAAVVLALCDFETRLWLAPEFSDAGLTLRFLTDAMIVPDPADAAFAIVAAETLDLGKFFAGTAAYPDRGATVIVQCPSLEGGRVLALAGPGLPAPSVIAPAGLPGDFVAQMAANRAGFPLGVDLILTCGATLMALPRSVRILAEAP